MVLDSRPFSQLSQILSDLVDDRIWVYAELVDQLYTPRTGATWTPGYHGARLFPVCGLPAACFPPPLGSVQRTVWQGTFWGVPGMQSAYTTSQMRPSGHAPPARAGCWRRTGTICIQTASSMPYFRRLPMQTSSHLTILAAIAGAQAPPACASRTMPQ